LLNRERLLTSGRKRQTRAVTTVQDWD
jgi:hypothetical protein